MKREHQVKDIRRRARKNSKKLAIKTGTRVIPDKRKKREKHKKSEESPESPWPFYTPEGALYGAITLLLMGVGASKGLNL